MAVINATDYLDIANHYADALTQIEGVKDFYYNAAYEIVILQAFDPEIDLLVPFYNAYLTASTAYGSVPQSAVAAVKKLQDHILIRGSDKDTGLRYTEINDYYADNPSNFPTGGSAVIPAKFATISQQAGHTIESTYIES